MAAEISPAIYPVIATITAAFIAAFVAFMTSMLSKELKTSEFRYSWLNAVLDDTATFLGAAQLTLVTSRANDPASSQEQPIDPSADSELAQAMAAYYRARIRLYPQKHASTIAAIDSLQAILIQRSPADKAALDAKLREVVQTTHEALKDEWEKVKRGELVFRWTKGISLVAVFVTLLLPFLFYFWPR